MRIDLSGFFAATFSSSTLIKVELDVFDCSSKLSKGDVEGLINFYDESIFEASGEAGCIFVGFFVVFVCFGGPAGLGL